MDDVERNIPYRLAASRTVLIPLALALFLAPACGSGSPHSGSEDSGSQDSGSQDSGAPDSGSLDSGIPDSGSQDSGAPDSGIPDAGVPDSGPPDSGAPDSGTPDSGTPDSGTPDSGTLITCTQPGTSCPVHTACVSDICVPSCANGASCPVGDYCESTAPALAVCSPVRAYPCVFTSQCPTPQTCSLGLCVAAEQAADGGSEHCTFGADGGDGCAPDAVCSAPTSPGTGCLGLTHCGIDGGCPPGASGSVCNDDRDGGAAFPGKERLCLSTFCRSTSNCPSTSSLGQAACFGANSAQLGHCYFGVAGDPCLTTVDCQNSHACLLADGGIDDGGMTGRCAN
jgi:hypothetical protein